MRLDRYGCTRRNLDYNIEVSVFYSKYLGRYNDVISCNGIAYGINNKGFYVTLQRAVM